MNYVECGKILVWKQLESFQVGYLLITVLIGTVVLLAAFRTNKLDVESGEDGIELEESRWSEIEVKKYIFYYLN